MDTTSPVIGCSDIPQQVLEEEEPKPAHRVLIGLDRELDKNAERLIRMTQVFSKFAGTLTLRPIKVDIDTECYSDAPAWSNSDSITFNKRKLGDLTDPYKVTSLKGLSLHEISHIMLTPRYGSILAKNVQKAGLWPAFNALEDQRIEMFMTAKFSNVSDWLTATVSHHLLSTPNQVPVSFPLVYGRKYLPSAVRKLSRDNYEQPHNVAELSSLIDRYIVLNLGDSKNYNVAFDIIQKYSALVSQLNGPNQAYPDFGKGWERIKDPNGHCSRKNGEWKSSSSKPLSKAQQEAMARKIVVTNGDDYDEQVMLGEGDNPEAGNGGDTSQILKDIIDKVVQSKRGEIAKIMKQFSGDAELTGEQMKPLPRHDFSEQHVVDTDTLLASKSFATELERLRAEYDPGWLRLQSQGKLNVQRYVGGCDVEEAFDQWDMGREDAVDIEAVVLLDISGSMSWTLKSAYKSMWAIKRALDRVNASTTVLTFGSTSKTLYSSDEKAMSNKLTYAYSEGATQPLKALRNARSILANSNRAIKIVIAITDGVWSESRESDEILMHLRKTGVLTTLAYVSNPDWQRAGESTTIDTHGCAVAVNVTNGKDLFSLARQMVKVGVASNLSR